jgi:hypothetical protein
MNEELTRVFEKYELEAMIEFYKNNDCSRRVARELATALLAEKAKPKVWDGAPEWADRADVSYKGNVKGKINMSIYTRELPRTRIDEIADEVWHEINKGVTGLPNDIIKRGLKKYAEELKGEA